MKILILTLTLTLTLTGSLSFGFEPFPKQVPVPEFNQQTHDKIELGKMLYFDKRLSKDDSVSCNSCHNVMGSGTDNLPTSKGIGGQFGGRNAPTVWNAALQSVQFWDGRAAQLEDQAKGPITNPIEMGMENHDKVIEKLKGIKGYQARFEKVFGPNSLNIDNVAKAIASYERTLVTPDSPYDRYLAGNKKAMSPVALTGMKLFQEKGCISCHSGPNFSGPALPSGQGFYQKFPTFPGSEYEAKYELTKDTGRATTTKNDADKNMWRVPTLRNVAVTGPYFHNGKVDKLDEAVRVMARVQLGKTLEKTEVTAIVAFLESLTGNRPQQTTPQLPQ